MYTDMCTQSVQLNIGLRKKSLMGVLAHYTNICQLQQYQYTAKHLYAHKSKKRCNLAKSETAVEVVILSNPDLREVTSHLVNRQSFISLLTVVK